MSVLTAERIVCEGCGRAAPYRPEFAGKRIQCKCGKIIHVPSLTGLPGGATPASPMIPRPEASKISQQVVTAAVEAARPVVEPARPAAEPARAPLEAVKVPEPVRTTEPAGATIETAHSVATVTAVAAVPAPSISAPLQPVATPTAATTASAPAPAVAAPAIPATSAPAQAQAAVASEPATQQTAATTPAPAAAPARVKPTIHRPPHTRPVASRAPVTVLPRTMAIVNAPQPLSPEESIYAMRAIPETPTPVRRGGLMAPGPVKEAPRKPQVSVILNNSTPSTPQQAPIAMEWKLTGLSRPSRPAEPTAPAPAPTPKPRAVEPEAEQTLADAHVYKPEVLDRKPETSTRRPETPERKSQTSDRKPESKKAEPKDRKAESSRPKPKAAEKKNETGQPRKKSKLARAAIIVGVLLAIIALPAIGFVWYSSHKTTPKPLVGTDKDVQTKLNKEPHQEIHAWFKQDSNRVMGPWTMDEALKTADEWKKDGATQVIAFGTHISTVAVIELPDNAAQRKDLFAWAINWNQQHDQKSPSDIGQHYLMIQLGI